MHVIGVSSQAAGHKTLVPDLIAALKNEDASDIIVVVGGVIPRQDYDFLYECGVKAIFGPGTKIPVSARKVLDERLPSNIFMQNTWSTSDGKPI